MTIAISRLLPHALLAALAFAAPVQAAVGNAGYTAALAKPLAAPKSVVLDGVVWRCAADRCTASGSGGRSAVACERVVKKFGAVSEFTAPEGVLPSKDLARCNLRAAG